MEDDAHGVAVAGAYAADTVAHVYAVIAAGSLHRAMVDGEGYCVTLAQRDHFGTGLLAGALFGEDELAAGKISTGFGQQEGDLYGEDMFAVEVLVEAVVVARFVLEEQGCGAGLAGGVTAFDENGVVVREADGDVH
jgi:hypothetical protein